MASRSTLSSRSYLSCVTFRVTRVRIPVPIPVLPTVTVAPREGTMTDTSETTSVIALARQAVDRGDWGEALEQLSGAGPGVRQGPEGLSLRGAAAYGAGDLEGSVTAFEELFAGQLERDDHIGAARAAGTVAMYLMMDTGLMAPVRAWLTRADRLLGDHEERPVHALVAMVRTYERFLCGDVAAVREWSVRAVEVGTQTRFLPAIALGRVAAARVSILDGAVEDGLVELDEVATMLLSGELDPLTTGMVWCELICAMQGLARHDRAEQWTVAMEQWRRDAAFGGINGRCRVHRAEILRLRGTCEEAEQEALRACEELRPWMRREFGWPLTELGTIRLRRGNLDGAEEAFLAAHERAWEPQPGFALLRLAQGDVDAAAAMIHDALERPLGMPFKERPPFGALRRAPLLDTQVEIASVADDDATARAAARELDSIAETYDSPALLASAGLATGRVALIDDDVHAAVEHLEHAAAAWVEIGAPYEAAVARTVLGEAHRRGGNDVCARLEWQTARAVFERLGSRLWADRLEILLGDGDGPTAVGAPAPVRGTPSANVFRSDGNVRTVCFDGDTVLLSDLKGMRYLARMLGEPGREFHVLDLVAVEHGSAAGDARVPDLDGVTRGGDAGFVLDDEARAAYRRRLVEIDDDIAEATRMNDPERRALAEADREYLVAELARATGLGGRRRRAGSTSERARSSVTRTLRYALDRIAEHHPTLGAHLEQTVQTGTYCVYRPDPRVPITWDV